MTRRIQSCGRIIKGYLKANKVSQKELADLSGYTEKQVSLILNDKSAVTPRFANAMEKSIEGLKASFILQYYEAYKKQCEEDKLFLNQNSYSEISKKYNFKKVFKKIDDDPVSQVNRVNEAFDIDNLNRLGEVLDNDALYERVTFSKDISKLDDRDNEVVTIWTKVAMRQIRIGEDEKMFVGVERAKQTLHENKDLLNVVDSEDLINNITYICDLCGIHIGFSKSAPTSYIRGLSFSLDGELYIVITDRFKRVEYVVFSFVHEMFHIINGDITVDSDSIRFTDEDDMEDVANNNARDFLIDKESYSIIKDINNPTFNEIYKVSKNANCSIGCVVARVHYDTKDYTKFWQHLNSFVIDIDMFGN